MVSRFKVNVFRYFLKAEILKAAFMPAKVSQAKGVNQSPFSSIIRGRKEDRRSGRLDLIFSGISGLLRCGS